MATEAPWLGQVEVIRKKITGTDDMETVERADVEMFRKIEIGKIEFGEWNPTRFDARAFVGSVLLEGVTIPKSVVTIGILCFQGCFSLKNVGFEKESQLKTVDDGAFCGTGLVDIVIPRSVESLGFRCFAKCRNLGMVTVERNSHLKVIGRDCFAGCNMLNYVEFLGLSYRIQNLELDYLRGQGGRPFNIADYVYSQPEFKDVVPREFSESIFRCSELCITNEVGSITEGHFRDSQWIKCVMFERRCSISMLDNLFNGSVLESIIIPSSVTTIGEKCLYGTKNLINVSFEAGSNLKVIGKSAFGRSGLKYIEIPASVVEIGEKCFVCCDHLDRVLFEKGSKLNRIGAFAFACSSLNHINIPKGVKEIPKKCFFCCTKIHGITFEKESGLERIQKNAFFRSTLKRIEIPASVEELCDRCCDNSVWLETVVFEQGSKLKRIGKKAFQCSRLREMEIPPSVETLDEKCFCSCTELKFVGFGRDAKLKSIGKNAFTNSALQQIAIPATVEELCDGCFAGCDVLDFSISPYNDKYSVCGPMILCDSGRTVVSAFRQVSVIEIPDTVETLGNSCFGWCMTLKSLVFSENSHIKRIEKNAFQFSSLKNIALPSSVEELCEGCFDFSSISSISISKDNPYYEIIKSVLMTKVKDSNNNKKIVYAPREIESIEIPTGIDELGYHCFAYSKASSITFEQPSMVQSLDPGSFLHSALNHIRIPCSVRRIGRECFGDSNIELIEFEIESELVIIENAAFMNSKLKYITIPRNVQELPPNCFSGCKSLDCVAFERGSKVRSIGDNAFSYSNLKRIVIPGSVEMIGNECFAYCKLLDLVGFGFPISNLKSIGKGAFASCGLKKIEIPSSVETISESCFYGCRFLQTVLFEQDSNLRHIDAYVFACSSLSSIIIPRCVEELRTGCFGDCKYLMSVEFEEGSEVAFIDKSAFAGSALEQHEIRPAGVLITNNNIFSSLRLACIFDAFERDDYRETEDRLQILSAKLDKCHDTATSHVDELLRQFTYREDRPLLSVGNLYQKVIERNADIFIDIPHQRQRIEETIMNFCEEQLYRYEVTTEVTKERRPQHLSIELIAGIAPAPAVPQIHKPTPQLVREIWVGRWGNGVERKQRLEAAGYIYQRAQDLVNRYTEAARRVWIGDYGKPPHQFYLLEKDGFDPEVVHFVYRCIKD